MANSSTCEGETAVAGAVLMALAFTGGRRGLVASTLHPEYRGVLETYLSDLPATLVDIPAEAGRVAAGSPGRLASH